MSGTTDAATAAETASPLRSDPTPHTPHPLLRFEQVSKWYGPVLALNQVTLTLGGGITGLVGANGAGKSTLIRLATGQIAPTIGRAWVGHLPAADWRARRLVGYCPDHDAFYEDLTGRRFVRAMAGLFGYPPAEARERTERVIGRVRMGEYADRAVRGYSKGMRQRVKLAQALLHDPPLLILDEPLSGIDPVGRRELLDLFADLAAGGTGLLVSSHELEELERLTDRVAIMARGRVAAVGTLAEIRGLLDDRPLSVRIDTARPRELAAAVLTLPEVVGVEADAAGVTVRATQPPQFFPRLTALLAADDWGVSRIEPLDESAHAVLGYLLGGSGKT